MSDSFSLNCKPVQFYKRDTLRDRFTERLRYAKKRKLAFVLVRVDELKAAVEHLP